MVDRPSDDPREPSEEFRWLVQEPSVDHDRPFNAGFRRTWSGEARGLGGFRATSAEMIAHITNDINIDPASSNASPPGFVKSIPSSPFAKTQPNGVASPPSLPSATRLESGAPAASCPSVDMESPSAVASPDGLIELPQMPTGGALIPPSTSSIIGSPTVIGPIEASSAIPGTTSLIPVLPSVVAPRLLTDVKTEDAPQKPPRLDALFTRNPNTHHQTNPPHFSPTAPSDPAPAGVLPSSSSAPIHLPTMRLPNITLSGKPPGSPQNSLKRSAPNGHDSQVRKARHKNAEKRRRNEMNEAIERLKTLLPADVQSKKLTKLDTLGETIAYIDQMKSIISTLARDNSNLRRAAAADSLATPPRAAQTMAVPSIRESDHPPEVWERMGQFYAEFCTKGKLWKESKYDLVRAGSRARIGDEATLKRLAKKQILHLLYDHWRSATGDDENHPVLHQDRESSSNDEVHRDTIGVE